MTLDGWLDRLVQPALAATYRCPIAVVRSLQRCNLSLALEDCLQLWNTYNERLIAVAAKRKTHIACFDWPVDRYIEASTSVGAVLDLQRPADAAAFQGPALRHQAAAATDDLPAEVARDCGVLQEISGW